MAATSAGEVGGRWLFTPKVPYCPFDSCFVVWVIIWVVVYPGLSLDCFRKRLSFAAICEYQTLSSVKSWYLVLRSGVLSSSPQHSRIRLWSNVPSSIAWMLTGCLMFLIMAISNTSGAPDPVGMFVGVSGPRIAPPWASTASANSRPLLQSATTSGLLLFKNSSSSGRRVLSPLTFQDATAWSRDITAWTMASKDSLSIPGELLFERFKLFMSLRVPQPVQGTPLFCCSKPVQLLMRAKLEPKCVTEEPLVGKYIQHYPGLGFTGSLREDFSSSFLNSGSAEDIAQEEQTLKKQTLTQENKTLSSETKNTSGNKQDVIRR
ncbi:hypothetical protein HUJ05_001634 [Dendroctonus ponderosae]|nr:hypothetical protein HUJ05_001634 [Dendroctonus ponderosae]